MSAKGSVTFEPKNASDLSAFLQANKDRYHEFWVVLTKKKCADPQPVSFSEAVKAAVELGLVDSKTKSLDEMRYAVRFTKRKAQKREL
jgi:hypothetical protein